MAHRQSQSSEAKERAKFRATSRWKDFRKKLKKERKVDELTLKPLYSGFQVHHLDMRNEHYKDISDGERFMALNSKTHEFLHWAYQYGKTDPDFMKRLESALRKMKEFNED